MSVSCQKVQDLLPSYIDDMVSAEEKEAIKEHLASCEICAAEETFLRNTVAVAKNLPQLAVSDTFRAKLHDRLLEETQVAPQPAKRKSVFMRYASGLVAAAAVVVLSVVTFSNLPDVYDIEEIEQPAGNEAHVTQQEEPLQDDGGVQTPLKTRRYTEDATPKAPIHEDVKTEETTPAQAAFSHEPMTEPAASCAEDADLSDNEITIRQRELRFSMTEAGKRAAQALLASYAGSDGVILIPQEKIEEIAAMLEDVEGYVSHTIAAGAARTVDGETAKELCKTVKVILETTD
ncbi:MAG: zf-HC2 domain-containing protein [Ruminococcaceae bacterium]|nr:zf-HC2 domain-containing protein [Oscillospiraceae bacterium]